MRTETLPALLPLVLLGLGCSRADGGGDRPLAGELQRREIPHVRTVPVVAKEMVNTLTLMTTVESELAVDIVPRVAGVVTELHAEQGDVVEADQTLARLDRRVAEAALQAAHIGLREAQQAVPMRELAREEAVERLERARLTFEQAARDFERNRTAGLISQQELDKIALARDQSFRDQQAAKLVLDQAVEEIEVARTAVERAELAIQSAELDLDFTEIRAPFAGIIADRSIKVGDTVSSAETAFVLTDPTRLRAVFYRPQREMPRFRAAAAAAAAPANGDGVHGAESAPPPIEILAEAEACPGVVFRGDIERISPTVDAASGSFGVTVRFEGANRPDREGLLPGMLVRLSVVTERHVEALVVPKRALRREGDQSFIFVVEAGVARRIGVREGFSGDEEVEVLPLAEDELGVGDAVVVIGNRELEDGHEVRAEPWAADEGSAAEG